MFDKRKLGIVVEALVLVLAVPARAHVAAWRFLALLGEHIIHELVLAFVGHHAPPGRALDIVIAVGAAPEHALAAPWRFLALVGERIIHELVVALVGHYARPGRWFGAIAAARRCSRVVGLVAIGAFGEKSARTVPVTGRHLARDRRVQRFELRPQRAMALLHLLERDDALHLLARVGLALEEGLQPHHGVEVARRIGADAPLVEGIAE
ncbi:MAG TPA: hypothetical protein VNM90_14735 [Haliangium sp.]|nr:hypothetical protein [Haliangium sp.]